MKELNKKMKTLKTAYKKLRDDFEKLEKENEALRSQAGISDKEKISIGISEEELRSIKEKYEKEAFQSKQILKRNRKATY